VGEEIFNSNRQTDERTEVRLQHSLDEAESIFNEPTNGLLLCSAYSVGMLPLRNGGICDWCFVPNGHACSLMILFAMQSSFVLHSETPEQYSYWMKLLCFLLVSLFLVCIYLFNTSHGSVVVKAQGYKPEGRGLETWWGEILNLPDPSGHTKPWGLFIL
jgi:hypothetical protein